jgi:hypothetical protein
MHRCRGHLKGHTGAASRGRKKDLEKLTVPLASVFDFFHGEPTRMRRPKRRRCWWITLVAANMVAQESRGQAASSACSVVSELNMKPPCHGQSVPDRCACYPMDAISNFTAAAAT